MKKSKFVKKCADGGPLESKYGQMGSTAGTTIGSLLGTTLGMASNAIVPGLGAVLTPMLSKLGGTAGNALGTKIGTGIGAPKDMQNQLNEMTVNKNPYGFAYGGMLTGREDAAVYKGRLHSNGGILVNKKGVPSGKPDAEVEGEETVVNIGGKSYIFSNRLKI